jgi:hypothetical protein
VQRITSKARKYLWAGKDRRARARVAWDVVCLKQKEGGLNMVNPKHALTALICKWIVYACKPSVSNFKILLRCRLMSLQPYTQGKWGCSFEWFTMKNHKASTRSKVWNRITKAWKELVSDVSMSSPSCYEEWLSSSFWWHGSNSNLGLEFPREWVAELYQLANLGFNAFVMSGKKMLNNLFQLRKQVSVLVSGWLSTLIGKGSVDV